MIYVGNNKYKLYVGNNLRKIEQPFYPIQIVKNPDFSEGLRYWTANSAYCTPSVVSDGIRLTKIGSSGYGAMVYQNPGLNKTHKYYQKVILRRGTTAYAFAGFCGSSLSMSNNTQMSTASTSFVTLDQVISPANNTDYLVLRAGSSTSTNNQYSEFKMFYIIDLTKTFGSGKEPTLEQCRQIFTNDCYAYYNP